MKRRGFATYVAPTSPIATPLSTTPIHLDGTFANWRIHARSLLVADTPPEAVRWVDYSAAAGPLLGLLDENATTPAAPSIENEHPAETSCFTCGPAAGSQHLPPRGRWPKAGEGERSRTKPLPLALTPAQPLPEGGGSSNSLLTCKGSDTPRVPKPFVALAQLVALHRSADRWALLYRVLWRLTHDEKYLLDLASDPDVRDLMIRHKAVRRDAHKMHAFVRFRSVTDEAMGGERFVAFHRPDHLIVRREAGWFRSRFPNLPFSLLTPDLSAHWDPTTRAMSFTPGVNADAAAAPDEVEALWLTYYRSTFNPARIKLNAMVKEMPRRYWPTLPETALIPQLLAEAPARLAQMEQYAMSPQDSAAPFVPDSTDLSVLAEAAMHCKGCPLYEPATQVVFGEGPASADLMLVGEQPGDNEDREGHPFIGPAGQKLDGLLDRAGIDRDRVYVTNAVKHFKFELRGKFRLHKKPGIREVNACIPWLEAEVAAVKPRVVVALGATAARALFGATFKITKQRGEVMSTRWAPACLATYHPSALLRVPDPDQAASMEEAIYHDLATAARLLDSPPGDMDADASPGTLF